MESIIKGLLKLRWQPQLQLVRYNTKLNVTKPRAPHFDRALVEKVCLPYFSLKKKPKHVPDFESCEGKPSRKSFLDEDHPLLKILAEENLNYFKKSKIVAFFHLNAISPEEKFEAQLHIKKNGMKLLFINKHVLKKALAGTQFEVVLDLYEATTGTVFGPDPDVYKLMNMCRKLSKFILMAAIVENRLLSLSDLKKYAVLKDISQARLNLLSTLNSSSQNLVTQINTHSNNLIGLLNQHKKVLEGNNN